MKIIRLLKCWWKNKYPINREQKEQIRKCVDELRNASVSIEGSISKLKNKANGTAQIQFILEVVRQNRRIEAALGILKDLNL